MIKKRRKTMGNGLVNVRDQKFILFEQIGIDKLFK
ncbi:MAG: acyl-CoA dehydrogenase N-terminal domain-containing protein [Deltaproteobacteria bacterium]|nr:acyl-CoA dehydrogenase N-terminal domain-containing protein [Deltaproteobacteria bacterium]